MRNLSKTTNHKPLGVTLALAVCLALGATGALADARTQAKRMHDRIAGVPPTEAVLTSMAALIPSDSIAAANIAMQNPSFYNVTLKTFVTPWTNEEQTVFAPLNDYTATVIGMIRDDKPFNGVLSSDILYVGAAGLSLPAYSNSNNDHYAQMEDRRIDLSSTANLVERTQSAITGMPANATAGIMTTRQAGRSFFIDGTNRAMFRFTSMNYLCRDLEQLKDVTRTPDRVRQDVARSPGGDSRIFMNSCVGCHAGMDPLVQAFAYYNYAYTSPETVESGQVVYTDRQVQPKYHINMNNFEFGYVTPNDRWDNYWRKGTNSLMGWDANLPGGGYGAKSMGVELANSQAFASCQVEKVFKNTCFRSPSSPADRAEVARIAGVFKANNYSMKRVFAETAAFCMGD